MRSLSASVAIAASTASTTPAAVSRHQQVVASGVPVGALTVGLDAELLM